MKNKIEEIKDKYCKANDTNAHVQSNDVIILIDFFLALFELAKDISPMLNDELKLDVSPADGGGVNIFDAAAVESMGVVNSAVMLKNGLKRSEYPKVASYGMSVSRAIIVLIESGCIPVKGAMTEVCQSHDEDLDAVLKRLTIV